MTRWARGGNAHKKKPHDASSWEELKQDFGKRGSKTGSGNRPASGSGHIVVQSKKQKLDAVSQKRTPSGTYTGVKSQKKKNRDGPNSGNSAQPGSSTQTVNTYNFKVKSEPFSGVPYSSKSIVDLVSETDRDVTTGDGKRDRLDDIRSQDDHQLTMEEIERKTARSEARRAKRQTQKSDKMVCFHCRQSGHGVADCPEMVDDVEQGMGICFRCGTTEHDVSKCTAKVDKQLGEFPYAKCFICQQTGHLSRSCPDNPRGLYPEGGGCKECGSVEHRWWNCPIRKPVKGVTVSVTPLVAESNTHTSADAEPAFMKKPRFKIKKKGPKVVMF